MGALGAERGERADSGGGAEDGDVAVTDLFPIPESLSPRDEWLRRHALAMGRLKSGKWKVALDRANTAYGPTPEHAIWEFCREHAMPVPTFLNPP